MKHFSWQDTISAFLVGLIISHLLVLPLLQDLLLAKSLQFDEVPPVINHRPFTLVVSGETILISALIGDDFGIKSATLTIFSANKVTEGILPKMIDAARTPVQVRILGLTIPVYTRPGAGKQIGEFHQGDRCDIYLVKDNYYQVKLANGRYGYIDGSETETIYTGYQFGAKIPIEIIKSDIFEYEIAAIDDNGHKTTSERFKARVVSKKKYAELSRRFPMLLSDSGTGLPEARSGITAKLGSKLWMIAGIAAIGSGVAIYLATAEDKPKETDGLADITVDW